jgi:hypothetical protein
VDRISEDQRQFAGGVIGKPEVEAAVTGITVFFDAKNVEVSLEKSVQHIVEIRDVLIGPFDL